MRYVKMNQVFIVGNADLKGILFDCFSMLSHLYFQAVFFKIFHETRRNELLEELYHHVKEKRFSVSVKPFSVKGKYVEVNRKPVDVRGKCFCANKDYIEASKKNIPVEGKSFDGSRKDINVKGKSIIVRKKWKKIKNESTV